MTTPLHRFLRLPLTLAIIAGAALSAAAQSMVPLDLTYARINLTNGRVLKQATLTGINRESDLIYVLEDRKLKPYPATSSRR